MGAEVFGHDLEACRAVLRDGMAEMGTEVTVSTAAPLTPSPYEYNPMTCPHGVTFYMQPTTEQVLAWHEAGVQ